MPSSASTVLRQELPAEGEKTGQWDDILNLNLQMLEAAIAGTTAIATTGGTTTLTNVDYTNDQAKKRVLNVTGVLVSNATIVIPNASKTYIVRNATTGSYTLTIKTSAGSGIVITQSTVCEVYCDGSDNTYFATPMTNYTTGAPATSSGAAASSVSVTATGNLSSTNVQAALAELQTDIDTINTSLSNKQALDADLTTLAGLSNTKGNIIVGGASGWTALTVGTDGLVLRAQSGAAAGVTWTAGLPQSSCTIFYQAAAPTGWTKNTGGYDNGMIRLTESLGGTTRGLTGFDSVFAARTITQANLPSYFLTVTDPGHTHTYGVARGDLDAHDGGSGPYTAVGTTNSGTYTTTSQTTGITVASGGSGTAMDFNAYALNFISCSAG